MRLQLAAAVHEGDRGRALELARVAQIPVAELHQMEVARRLARLPLLLRLLAEAVRRLAASQGRVARGRNPPGSPRTERDSLPSLRSCHLDHQRIPDPRPVGEVAGIPPGDSLPGRPSFLLGP